MASAAAASSSSGGLEAGNYMYVMSYHFQDDGTIAFRLGATGQNLPGHRQEAHVHSAHWRIDIDLIDGSKNSAMLMRHVEPVNQLSAEDQKEPFNGGLEGGVDWDPKEFTMIRVESEKENARRAHVAYDLMPVRQGTPRHNEEFTRHDLWVSRSHPERPAEFLFANLPNIVKDEEVIEQTDIVVWCNSAVHHEPRHEDGKPNLGRRLWPGDDAWEGSALLARPPAPPNDRRGSRGIGRAKIDSDRSTVDHVALISSGHVQTDREIAHLTAGSRTATLALRRIRQQGRKIVNRDPSPTRLVSSIWPPMDWMRCFTIESPKPVPPSSRLRSLSTR